MIQREIYLKQLIQAKDNGLPKVVTGIRRCGKSTLLKDLYTSWLKENGVPEDHILFLSLDKDENAECLDPLVLGQRVRSWCRGKDRCYVFLDEIQRVRAIHNPIFHEGKHLLAKPSDEDAITFVSTVLGLSDEKNIDLYLTGSNSKMLSSSIATEFRGKSTNISMGPLSFGEFASYRKEHPFLALQEYLKYGGMPQVVLAGNEDKKTILKSLFDAVYFKDIMELNSLRKEEFLDELCNIISESTGGLLNVQKIANTFQSKEHKKLDPNTIQRYLHLFEDSFLIRAVPRYDVKGRKKIGAMRKYYFVDPGLKNARTDFIYEDIGQTLENVVFNELIYRGYTVSVGVYEKVSKEPSGKSVKNTFEIDFFATKGIRQYYIQVCNDLSSPSTYEREIKPYLSLVDEIQKIIVVNSPIEESRTKEGYWILSASDFLLRFIA